MWLVVFGFMPVASGGGEYMAALFFGLPPLLFATALFGVLAIKRRWQSKVGIAAFTFSLILLCAWLSLFIGGNI
jgi:hypothetical protein